MARRLCAFGLALLTVAGATDGLLACGDKFLVANRGTRFQRAAVAREPAAILIHVNPALDLVAGASLDATLRKVGYRPTTVATPEEFEKAVSRGGWDLVLVSVANAASAQDVSKRLPNNVAVIPVITNTPNTELVQIRKQYKVVLRAPAKSQALVDAIDEALAHRPKAQRKVV